MKKIVKGNDFTLRIPVSRMFNGVAEPFPLPGCTDIVVNVVSSYRRISLPYAIDVSDDHIINARVEGDAIPRGVYALEVKGKFLGNDWRSNEYEQFSIVDNNASGDTAFTPQEGEDSVLMNTAIAILAPDVELGGLIKDAEKAIANVDEKLTEVDSTVGEAVRNADAATEQATTAAAYANTQADRAKAVAEVGMRLNQSVQTAENLRIQAEKERVLAEEGRSTAESKRQVAESGRNDAEVSRFNADMAMKIADGSDDATASEYKGFVKWLRLELAKALGTMDALTAAKAQKVAEIDAYDQSEAVNGFTLNGAVVWLDKATRVGLMNSTNIAKATGSANTTLWLGGERMVVPCDKAIKLLSALEMYALSCFNVTASHKAAVEAMTTIDEVLAYDYKKGYPERLKMEV